MVAAISNAGGLGSLPLGYVAPENVAAAIAAVRASTDRPFACNLFVDTAPPFDAALVARARDALAPYRAELGLPEPSGTPVDKRLSFSDQCDAIFACRPRVFSFTFGIPERAILERARALGIATIGTAKTVDDALALETAGVDAVCVQGFEAGGHHGSFASDPADAHVGILALVPQVVDAIALPVIAAGGIGDGRGIAAVLTLGAAAAQIGSAFLLADESVISRAYRERLQLPDARHTRFTTAFSGRTARGVRNRFMDELADSDTVAPYPDQNALTRDIRDAAAAAGEAALLSLWAGQAVSLAVAESTLSIVGRLMRETSEALDVGLTVFRGFHGREAYADVPMEHTDGALANEHPETSVAPPVVEPVSIDDPIGSGSDPELLPVEPEETASADMPVEHAVPILEEPAASEFENGERTLDEAARGETPQTEALQSEASQNEAPPAQSAPSEPASSEPASEVGPAAAKGAPRTLGIDPAVVERKRKAQESWDRAVAAHASGGVLEGTVTSAVKGGLLVDVDGVRGFLPASQASPGPGVAIETLVKQKLPLKIIDVDAARKRVVVSHRRAAESAKRAARTTLLKSLAIGQRYEATVVRLADFGAFVDIGSGVDGLVPMSELAFERIEKVGDLLKVGDTFEATVIRIEEGGRKIALSRKGALPDPWRDHADVVRIGATIEGTVVGKEPRLQVEIAPGVVGAVRESDADPGEYEIGEKIEVSVRNLDRRTRRITLTTLHGAAAAIVTNSSKQTGGFATLGEELMARTKTR